MRNGARPRRKSPVASPGMSQSPGKLRPEARSLETLPLPEEIAAQSNDDVVELLVRVPIEALAGEPTGEAALGVAAAGATDEGARTDRPPAVAAGGGSGPGDGLFELVVSAEEETGQEADAASPKLARSGGPAVVNHSEQIRFARLHLRTGSLLQARSEFEALAAYDLLDLQATLDLAEVRWRTGDLAGAGIAALAYLAARGEEALGFLIAAEAAAAEDRVVEARRHAGRALERSVSNVDVFFAGVPRRMSWPESAWTAPVAIKIEGSMPGTQASTAASRAAEVPVEAPAGSLWTQPEEVAPAPEVEAAAEAEPAAVAEPAVAPGVEAIELVQVEVEPEAVAAEVPLAAEPEAVAAEPGAVEPEAVAAEVPAVEPEAVEPEAVAAEVPAVEPEAVEPEAVAAEVPAVEPEAVEPEAVAAEVPAVEPEAVEPEAVAAEPEAVTAEPEAVEPEAVAAEVPAVEPEAVEPEAVTAEPEAVTAEPEAVEPEAVAAEVPAVEPEAVEPEAVAAEVPLAAATVVQEPTPELAPTPEALPEPPEPPEPAAANPWDGELHAGSEALASGDALMAALHFAVALRMSPESARAVVGGIGERADLALELVRSDALRLLGNESDAGQAYASVASRLGRSNPVAAPAPAAPEPASAPAAPAPAAPEPASAPATPAPAAPEPASAPATPAPAAPEPASAPAAPAPAAPEPASAPAAPAPASAPAAPAPAAGADEDGQPRSIRWE